MEKNSDRYQTDLRQGARWKIAHVIYQERKHKIKLCRLSINQIPAAQAAR